MFYKEVILKIQRKAPVMEFNIVTGLYPATLLKEKTPMQVFSDEYCEIFRTVSLQNTSR